ncbi:hypothetical protein EB796_022564 [Bugula neritina]|uniref:HBS1-like protein N-terminal domain-containing protein n=1 Tax=Bugula neritina TaxID=10212 RepID=A0A7J7J013_BUGNE|nr:hypothetical protein EB796_022564 [Bugula neritina]
MSRHRHFVEINQKYKDQYGVSPSTAAEFTFNRDSRGNASFADYLNKEEERGIPEETIEDVLDDSGSLPTLLLSNEDEVKLRSCLDEVQNIIGDTIPEMIVKRTIINNKFDLERSLDTLLTNQSSHSSKSTGDSARSSSVSAMAANNIWIFSGLLLDVSLFYQVKLSAPRTLHQLLPVVDSLQPDLLF